MVGWVVVVFVWFLLGCDIVVGVIILGVGMVLSFLFILFVFYFVMSFLEDSGYMVCVVFLMDWVMCLLGFDGCVFILLILGFGCNVFVVSVICMFECCSDWIVVSMILFFMSCLVCLLVYVIFVVVFFLCSGSWVVWGMYVLGMLVVFVFVWVLRKILYLLEGGGVLFELLFYCFFVWKVLWKYVWCCIVSFVCCVWIMVFVMVVGVWFLLVLFVVSGGYFVIVLL